MRPDLFGDDLHRKPEVLRRLAAGLREHDPWEFLAQPPQRVVLLGMGSSAYAGGVVAARLRAGGLVAVSELASSDLLPRWDTGTLAVAVSASGRSRETLDALGRLPPGVTTVALTNETDSDLAARCDHVVPMHAETEVSGVACRTFQHTLVTGLALEARLRGTSLLELAETVERSAEATEHLLRTTDDWLPETTRLLAGTQGTHLAAPARRLSSAQQGALMLREVPRRAAVACEAGDWAHVDVYLTKNTDYRLLVFAGSSWDDGILEWTRPRGTDVVAVGGELPGAAVEVRYPHDDVDDVRLLTEVLVPELVAADLLRQD
jgi:fructoselysine-6-P-deglycase FrlB-like protein